MLLGIYLTHLNKGDRKYSNPVSQFALGPVVINSPYHRHHLILTPETHRSD